MDLDGYEGFCTQCSWRIKSFENITACPNCGDSATPCGVDNQVNISINWQELRILCMWAEHYARHIGQPGTVFSIATRIKDQHPDQAPLTYSEEITQMERMFPSTSGQAELERDRMEYPPHDFGDHNEGDIQ